MILRAVLLMTADRVEAVDWGSITRGEGGRGAEEQEEGVSKALREYYAAAVATGRATLVRAPLQDGYNEEEEEGDDGILREAGQCGIDALLRRAARNVMAAKWEKEAADGDEAATAGKEEGGKGGAEDKPAPPPLPPPPPTPPPT
jgi:hypothetical protein